MPLEKFEFSSRTTKEKENIIYAKSNKIIDIEERRGFRKFSLGKEDDSLSPENPVNISAPEEAKIYSIDQWKKDTTYTISTPSPMNDDEIITDEDLDDEIPDDIKEEFEEKKVRLEKILKEIEANKELWDDDECFENKITRNESNDDFYIPMKPIREYDIKIKVESVEKANPDFIIQEDI